MNSNLQQIYIRRLAFLGIVIGLGVVCAVSLWAPKQEAPVTQVAEVRETADKSENLLDDIAAYPGSAGLQVNSGTEDARSLTLCQAQEPYFRCGVDCGNGCACQNQGWQNTHTIPWQAFGPGEYAGPARPAHVQQYRIRVGDQLEFIYRRTREMISTPYRLNVGDKIRV